MFCDEQFNLAERRAALHMALRTPADTPIVVEGEIVVRIVTVM